MESKRDLHNHSGKLQLLVRQIPDWCFSEQKYKKIQVFYEELVLENLSKVRIHMYITKVKELVRILPKNISEYTKEDIKKLIFYTKRGRMGHIYFSNIDCFNSFYSSYST